MAQSIHPLLKNNHCEEGYYICVINELNEEYKKNNRLVNKFFWVEQEEYKENRKKCFLLKEEIRTAIKNAFYFIRETARDQGLGVSKVDIIALSHSYVLKIPLVTDDGDLLELAEEYEVDTLKTIQLIKHLYDCGKIDMKQVRAIAEYWIYLNDTPKSYSSDYKKLFKEDAPR